MKNYTKEEAILNKDELINKIKQGSIFIYPTDTLYGIGCNALNSDSVKKIRSLKQNNNKPFSVIVPSEEWIINNCNTKNKEEYLKKLPGAYTLIFNLKNKESISAETNCGSDTLGVRIPDNWFTKLVQEAEVPIITTSVNTTGQKPITNVLDVPILFKDAVNFIIDDGHIDNSASTIIVLTKDKAEIIERMGKADKAMEHMKNDKKENKKVLDDLKNGKKLKVLASSDIHGDTDLAEKLAKRAADENVDLVILCGDLFWAVFGVYGVLLKDFGPVFNALQIFGSKFCACTEHFSAVLHEKVYYFSKQFH